MHVENGFMKTKIIYISGSEVFNMSAVREAFETVRHELGLSKDTVLFGVPVDADDAFDGKFESVTTISTPTEDVATAQPIVTETMVATTAVAEPVPEIMEEPVKAEKPKRSRKKSGDTANKVETTEKQDAVVEEPNSQDVEEEIIPILSILGDEQKNSGDTVLSTDDNTDVVSVQKDTEIIQPIIEPVPESNIVDTKPEFITETSEESDSMDTDDTSVNEPEVASVQDDEENQLEKLLQSVQSLNEDKIEVKDVELKIVESEPEETDATLEKLAMEFAENQDKIENTTKSSVRGGRIGKLKNILPFKKSKKNEPSLMGDLFGWAGEAANDDDFSMPDFFPTDH